MSVCEITLTRGYVTLVSPEDYERLIPYKWQASISGARVYARRGEKDGTRQRTIRMHRVITNAPVGMEVDHINGDTLDNRRENLRVCTKRQNIMNSGKRAMNRSGYIGVYLEKTTGRWAASVRGVYLGLYDTPEAAAHARDTRAREVNGEFARLNFPGDTTPAVIRKGGPPMTNTSGYRGVSFRKDEQKWVARVRKDGKRHFLGYFTSAEDAAAAIAQF